MAKKLQTTAPVSALDKIYDRPWKHALGAVAGVIAMYFAASWAIDSGRLQVYALTLFLMGGVIWHIVSGIKKVYGK